MAPQPPAPFPSLQGQAPFFSGLFWPCQELQFLADRALFNKGHALSTQARELLLSAP